MFGVKIYSVPESIPKTISKWKDLGFDTIFLGLDAGKDKDFTNSLKKEGFKTFIIFPVFYDTELIEQDPSLCATTAKGLPAKKEWVEFLCPSRKKTFEIKKNQLIHIIEELNPDGISLDFIRHFAFWEKNTEKNPPELKDSTCFCPTCIESFTNKTGIMIPEDLSTEKKSQWIFAHYEQEWTSWKSKMITRTAEILLTEAKKIKPSLKIGIHIVPWKTGDYKGAITKTAGQDVLRLGSLADFLTPMCYSHMLRKSPSWISEITEDLKSYKNNIVPSIQVNNCYRQSPISNESFTHMLKESLKNDSEGVIFWNWEMLSSSKEKQKTIKNKGSLR